MNELVRVGALGVCMGIIPLLIGMLYTKKKTGSSNQILLNWVSGFAIGFGIFQLVAIPCIFQKTSLTFLSLLYAGVLLFLCLLSLALNFKRIPKMLKELVQTWKGTSWLTIIAFAVILFQAYMYVSQTHVDDDDAFYVATSTTAVETDSMYRYHPYTGNAYKSFPERYVLSPFSIWVAVLGRLFGIHAAFLSHTVLPAVLLSFSYAVFALIGYQLFTENRQKTAGFVLISALLLMFTSSTVYMQGSFLLLRIWQGKAVLASALLPLVFYQGLKLLQNEWERRDTLFLLFVTLACCMVSAMGIILSAISVGILGILALIIKKSAKDFARMFLCVVPNLIFAAIFVWVL